MSYNKQKWIEEKEAEKKQWAQDALDSIKLYERTPEEIQEYFSFMANMYAYSPRNIGMMHEQYEGAHFVAGKERYDELGFDILPDQKPIKILVPKAVTYAEVSPDKLVQYKYLKKEQKEMVKNNELKTVKKTFFSLGDVYDITQTNAEPKDYPKAYPNGRIDFDVSHAEIVDDLLNANTKFLEQRRIPVKIENFSENGLGAVKGYSDPVNHIVGLNQNLTKTEMLHTLLHESAHAVMHKKDISSKMKTEDKELEAELTSFIVSKHFGIDTSSNTIPYIATWTKNLDNVKDMEESLKRIQATTKEMIQGIEHYIDFEKINELDLVQSTEKELEVDKPIETETVKDAEVKIEKGQNDLTALIDEAKIEEFKQDIGLDERGFFNEPLVYIQEHQQLTTLDALDDNIYSGHFKDDFEYLLIQEPKTYVLEGQFNQSTPHSFLDQVKIDCDMNGVPDIYENMTQTLRDKNQAIEKEQENSFERTL